MSRPLRIGLAVLVVALLGAWFATEPRPMSAAQLPAHTPDAAAGEAVFWAGGCASCHATPIDGKRAKGAAKLALGGGLELDTPYGVFRAPNISSHPQDGIGSWSMLQFVNAMQRGVSPTGQHYYPAFPYTSYARMKTTDVMDLKAYLDTLAPLPGVVDEHSLGLPWSLRRGIGAWKWRYLDAAPVLRADALDDQVARGRELVEGAGHCGECHTPRDAFGGLDTSQWLAGAANPDGDGKVPNITPAGTNVSEWTAADLAYYLESGFTPEFDTVGGSMVAVQENMAMLSAADREAIAAYLKAVPPVTTH